MKRDTKKVVSCCPWERTTHISKYVRDDMKHIFPSNPDLENKLVMLGFDRNRPNDFDFFKWLPSNNLNLLMNYPSFYEGWRPSEEQQKDDSFMNDLFYENT